ncbi:hypothetical protein COOONC_19090 [Cooperia oncophora]
MPSYSEPPTPIHEVDYLCTQLETSSCDDINNLKLLGKVKGSSYGAREEIDRFLKDHANEDLGNYISELRCFARSNGGLVLDEYRAKIWPVLARRLVQSDEDEDIDYDSISSVSDSISVKSSSTQDTTHESEDEEELRSHPEWNQVALDVHRTLARFPPNISDEKRTTLQDQLIPLIVRVLRSNPRFRYYQGFHDVCLTVILVCGKDVAYEVCKNLATHGPFRSYLLKSLEKSVLKELELLYVILSRADPQLERVLREVHLGTMFALSWPLTWFSHSLNHYQQGDANYSSTSYEYAKRDPLGCHFVGFIISRFTYATTRSEKAILSDSLYLASLMPPLALKTEFSRLYRQRIKARAINRRWAPVSRYAITMVAAVGIAGAAYYFNLGNRFAFSL